MKTRFYKVRLTTEGNSIHAGEIVRWMWTKAAAFKYARQKARHYGTIPHSDSYTGTLVQVLEVETKDLSAKKMVFASLTREDITGSETLLGSNEGEFELERRIHKVDLEDQDTEEEEGAQ